MRLVMGGGDDHAFAGGQAIALTTIGAPWRLTCACAAAASVKLA